MTFGLEMGMCEIRGQKVREREQYEKNREDGSYINRKRSRREKKRERERE